MGRLISRRNNLNFFDSVDVRNIGLTSVFGVFSPETIEYWQFNPKKVPEMLFDMSKKDQQNEWIEQQKWKINEKTQYPREINHVLL